MNEPRTSAVSTRKVVVNACYGGFSLSVEGEKAYLARKGKTPYFYVNSRDESGHIDFGRYERYGPDTPDWVLTYTLLTDMGDVPTREDMNSASADKAWFTDRDIPRDDPDLVAVVEELGQYAAGRHASLTIVEIPGDVEWVIDEYDGLEQVEEAHRVWH